MTSKLILPHTTGEPDYGYFGRLQSPEVITVPDAQKLNKLRSQTALDVWNRATPEQKLLVAKNLGKLAVNFGMDMIPGLGDLKGAQEAITGTQPILEGVPGVESKLTIPERIGAGLGALPFIPSMAGILKKVPELAPLKKTDIITAKPGMAEGGNPFKNSMVQEPVYHGTRAKEFDVFDTTKGAFFTPSAEDAKSYTKIRQSQVLSRKVQSGKPRVISSYLNVNKPLDLSAFTEGEGVSISKEKLRELLGNPSDHELMNAIKKDNVKSRVGKKELLLKNLYHNDPMEFIFKEVFNLPEAKRFPSGGSPQNFISAYNVKIFNGEELVEERVDSIIKNFLENLGFDSIKFNDTAVGSFGNQKGIQSIAVFHPDQIKIIPSPSRPTESGKLELPQEIKPKK